MARQPSFQAALFGRGGGGLDALLLGFVKKGPGENDLGRDDWPARVQRVEARARAPASSVQSIHNAFGTVSLK